MKIEEELNVVLSSEQQKVIINLSHTSNCLAYYQHTFMSKYDLSMQQFNILRILRGAKEPLNVHTVKERMIEKSPNITRLLDKMVDKGIIERIRCKVDKRVLFVKITEQGLELLARLDKDDGIKSLFPKSLSDEEARTLNDLLDKLRAEFK
jgi:MarR family transcriptional regulator, 2-MHQ and catechol-resistance regulon repressor